MITHDNSFYELRRRYSKSHPRYKSWHLFDPEKFLDHINLIKFKIESSPFGRSFLSVLSNDFDLLDRVRTLADTLSRIIDLNSATGLELTNEIATIRSQHIYNVDAIPSLTKTDLEPNPVDEVLSKVLDYYSYEKGYV